MRIGNGHQIKAGGSENFFRHALHLLAVLQAARRMEGKFYVGLAQRERGQRAGALQFCGNDLAQVARHRTDARGLVTVGGVMRQQVAIFAHRGAAAAGRHDDGLDFTAFKHRPPGIDQGAHVGQALVLIIEVIAQRTATAGARRLEQRNAEPVEHARRGGVDVGRQHRLHATGEHQHFSGVTRGRPDAARRVGRRHLATQCAWQQRSQQAPRRHQRRKQP